MVGVLATVLLTYVQKLSMRHCEVVAKALLRKFPFLKEHVSFHNNKLHKPIRRCSFLVKMNMTPLLLHQSIVWPLNTALFLLWCCVCECVPILQHSWTNFIYTHVVKMLIGRPKLLAVKRRQASLQHQQSDVKSTLRSTVTRCFLMVQKTIQQISAKFWCCFIQKEVYSGHYTKCRWYCQGASLLIKISICELSYTSLDIVCHLKPLYFHPDVTWILFYHRLQLFQRSYPGPKLIIKTTPTNYLYSAHTTPLNTNDHAFFNDWVRPPVRLFVVTDCIASSWLLLANSSQYFFTWCGSFWSPVVKSAT